MMSEMNNELEVIRQYKDESKFKKDKIFMIDIAQIDMVLEIGCLINIKYLMVVKY